MKIYFDESGNTGCLTREGHETYCGKDGQSLYALGAVLSPESEEPWLHRMRRSRSAAELLDEKLREVTF